jgi:FkbM family methyltransferase
LRVKGGPTLEYGVQDDPAYLFDELFLSNGYGVGSFYRPRPGDVIVDVGANIGWFALLCRWCARGPVHIHCFEPDPETLSRLHQNLDVNGLNKEVRIHPFAVSNRNGRATFSRTSHPLCRGLSAGGDLEVECVALGDAIRMTGDAGAIDMLKIDIEGGELEAIGASAVGDFARVDRVALEWHDRYRPGCLDACRSKLASAGFGCLRIDFEDDRRDLGLLRASRERRASCGQSR